MKQDKRDILRLKNLITSDEVKSGEDFKRLLIGDTIKVLREYLDVKELPVVDIRREEDGFIVNIYVKASAIKNFSVLFDE